MKTPAPSIIVCAIAASSLLAVAPAHADAVPTCEWITRADGRNQFRIDIPLESEEKAAAWATADPRLAVRSDSTPVTSFSKDIVPDDDHKELIVYSLRIPVESGSGRYVVTPEPLEVTTGVSVECLAPEGAAAEENLGWLERNTITPKYAEDGHGNAALGIDFDLKISPLDFAQGQSVNWPEGLDLNIRSRGYVVVPGNDTDSDSIETELSFAWQRVWFPYLEEADETVPEGADPVEHVIGQIRDGKFEPLALEIDGHAKHETRQTFGKYDIASGIGVRATFPFPRVMGLPAPLLPLLPLRLINLSGTPVGAQQPYFYANIDYVARGRGETDGGNTTDDEDYPRGSFEAAWQGEFFAPDVWLYADARLWFALGAPNNIERAQDDLEYHVDAGLKIPAAYFLGFREKLHHATTPPANAEGTGGDSSVIRILRLLTGTDQPTSAYVVLKYVQGALPPDFEEDEQVSAGFQIEF